MIYIICQKFDIYNYVKHVMEILLDISERILKKKIILFKLIFYIFVINLFIAKNYS